MPCMKQICWISLALVAVMLGTYRGSALSEELPRPKLSDSPPPPSYTSAADFRERSVKGDGIHVASGNLVG